VNRSLTATGSLLYTIARKKQAVLAADGWVEIVKNISVKACINEKYVLTLK
jgi:hypothetical protein